MGVKVREIGIDELKLAIDVLNHIPEFDTLFYKELVASRLSKTESIIIIAEFAGKPIGCKIAYNRYFDGSLYSWLGGVLPPFRNQGIAYEMLVAMEQAARKKFFLSIRFKSRNCHVDMLRFAFKHGFQVIGFEPKDNIRESGIELIKML